MRTGPGVSMLLVSLFNVCRGTTSLLGVRLFAFPQCMKLFEQGNYARDGSCNNSNVAFDSGPYGPWNRIKEHITC